MSLTALRTIRSRITFTHLICFVFFIGINGCKPHKQAGTAESFVENGVVWAYGSVQLADVEGPAAIMLKSSTPDQAVDIQSAQPYQLYGAIQARVDGGIRDLAYVDYHAHQNKLLAFSYQLDFQQRVRTRDKIIDIYAVLRKSGRSYYGRQKVLLGSARFETGSQLATVQLGKGLKLALIAGGVYAGQWALYYPEVQKVVVKPYAGMCPRFVAQMPGQNPSQSAGQFETCKPLPPKVDLCNGDPTRSECRPKPPVQRPLIPSLDPVTADPNDSLLGTYAVSGLEVVDGGRGVYAMAAELKDAKLIFTAAQIQAESDEQNVLFCERKFNALARTVGRQVNAACILKPAPASPVDGRMSCGVTVSFDRAETYLEKVCDIVVTFKDDVSEVQAVQVLKR